MKRARTDEQEGEAREEEAAGLSPLEVLNEDVLYLIAAQLEEPRDLMRFARSCRRLYASCRINNLWAGMLYRWAHEGAAGAVDTLVQHTIRTFLTWLGTQFSSAEMIEQHYLASVSVEHEAGPAGRTWPVYVFAHRPPELPGGSGPTLYLRPGMASLVQHEVSNNCLIDKIRDLVYATMQQFSKTAKGLGTACTCTVCRTHAPPVERERGGFKLISPFDAPFPASLLWYTVFKMCAIDAALRRSYVRQQRAAVALWTTLLESYAQEISLSMIGHPEAKPAIKASHDGGQPIARRPCAWYRPSAQSIASAEQAASGSTRTCSHCLLPMPFRSNQLVIARAVKGANPFGQSGNNVYCSTGCFLDEVLADAHSHEIACSNPRCTNRLTLREAVNLDRFIKRPAAPSDSDLLPVRRALDIIQDGREVKVFCDMRVFDVSVRESMYEFEALVDKAKKIALSNLDSTLPSPFNAAAPLPPSYMLCMSSVGERATVDINALAGYRGCPEEAWDQRHKIFESCVELLDASAPPWRFVGSRLPLPRVLYPTNELRPPPEPAESAPAAATLALPFSAYCCHSCALPDSRGPDARCLNSACNAPFNICTATISFECFEVLYCPDKEGAKSASRGYVCDRHCFEMYIEERQQELLRVSDYLKRKRQRTQQ